MNIRRHNNNSRDQTCWISHIHDDVIKWKHFLRYWSFVRGIHRSPVNSPHKGQWRRALMFSLIFVWTNGWADHRDAGDLRRHRAHYNVIVMHIITLKSHDRKSPANGREKPNISRLRDFVRFNNKEVCRLVYRCRGFISVNIMLMMTSSNGNISALLAICVGKSPVNSPHKGQWRGALMFTLTIVRLVIWDAIVIIMTSS